MRQIFDQSPRVDCQVKRSINLSFEFLDIRHKISRKHSRWWLWLIWIQCHLIPNLWHSRRSAERNETGGYIASTKSAKATACPLELALFWSGYMERTVASIIFWISIGDTWVTDASRKRIESAFHCSNLVGLVCLFVNVGQGLWGVKVVIFVAYPHRSPRVFWLKCPVGQSSHCHTACL